MALRSLEAPAETPLRAVDWRGWALALAATLASAIVTPLVRGAVVGGMEPITLLLLRLSLAVVLIGGSVALFDPHLLKLSRRGLWDVAWIGLISGVEICCFFVALAWVDGSMSAMIKSTQPLVVLLLLALGGERLTVRHGVRLVLAFVGVYLLVGPDGAVAPMGLLLLTLSIFLYATQLVFIQWRLLAYDSRTVTFYLLLVMTVVVVAWWGVQGAPWVDPGWRGWLVIAVLVVVSTHFARLALFGAMRRVGSGQVALLWPLQTLLAISLSVIFLDEHFSPIQWVGGAFILTSALLAIESIRLPFPSGHVSIQPPGNLTGAFRGAVHLQTISEPSKYDKRRSSLVQPEQLLGHMLAGATKDENES